MAEVRTLPRVGPAASQIIVAGYALRLDTTDPDEQAHVRELQQDLDGEGLAAFARNREATPLTRRALRELESRA